MKTLHISTSTDKKQLNRDDSRVRRGILSLQSASTQCRHLFGDLLWESVAVKFTTLPKCDQVIALLPIINKFVKVLRIHLTAGSETRRLFRYFLTGLKPLDSENPPITSFSTSSLVVTKDWNELEDAFT